MVYDIIIVGGGPAGMTAAIYGKRANKSVLMFEKMFVGGQTALTFDIENYPGFKKIDGQELSQNMCDQALDLGTEILYDDVIDYSLTGDIKVVKTHKNTYEAKTIILCMGASVKPLNIPNEKRFLGKGVSYCATCDGNFFKGKNVALIGGGNTSLQDCLYLTNLCKKVYLIHRRDQFRGEGITSNKIFTLAKDSPEKLELLLSSEVVNAFGNENLEQIEVKNKKTDLTTKYGVEGLFIAVGRKPDTDLLKGIVNLDERGYIVVDREMQTNVKGVYGAGDVTNTPLRQIVTACADGAVAASMANDYINEME